MNRKMRKCIARRDAWDNTLWGLIAIHLGGSMKGCRLTAELPNQFYLKDVDNFLFDVLNGIAEYSELTATEITEAFVARVKDIQKLVQRFAGTRKLPVLSLTESELRSFMAERWSSVDEPLDRNFWLRKALQREA
jgi:hypothetical protein